MLLDRPNAGPVVASKLADYTLRLYASRGYLDRHGTPTRDTIAAAFDSLGTTIVDRAPIS